MKLIIKTVYDNIDNQWLQWYLDRLENSNVLPGSMSISKKLARDGNAEYLSKDPTSNTTAITTYEIEK